MARNLDIIKQAIGPVLEGMVKVTIPLAVLSCLIGLILAFLLILMRYSGKKVLVFIANALVWTIRGLPLLVSLYFLFYGLAEIDILLSPWMTSLIAFSLFEAAFMSEAIRGALMALDVGQWEAGLSLGMDKYKVFRKIIIPQVIPPVLPTLLGYFISALKLTSLVSSIGLSDMMLKGKQFIDYYYAPFTIYLLLAVLYLVLFAFLSFLQNWLSKRFSTMNDDHLVRFM